MEEFLAQLNNFLNADRWNGWIEGPGISMYLRKNTRGGKRTLDLSNIMIRETGQGTFTALQPKIEAAARAKGFEQLMIENVLTERFAKWWDRQPGYHRHPWYFYPPCFFKDLTRD